MKPTRPLQLLSQKTLTIKNKSNDKKLYNLKQQKEMFILINYILHLHKYPDEFYTTEAWGGGVVKVSGVRGHLPDVGYKQ